MSPTGRPDALIVSAGYADDFLAEQQNAETAGMSRA